MSITSTATIVENPLERWIAGFPKPSQERLDRINQATTAPAHIIMALTYGLTDRHIRSLNRMIIGLMLCRHKAVRRGDTRIEGRIEAKLKQLHSGINAVVGPPPQGASDTACKTVPSGKRSGQKHTAGDTNHPVVSVA